ncbi:galactosyltransferase-related protein [Pseudomonas sp. NPDC007930]|uniref:glycosyltransferase family 2 protein n=1 Tax=Pseudomonas sp. NPDC007930 TaxID=3364417 RepID=UPI0036E2FA4E
MNVITLVKGRQAQLLNLIQGLEQSLLAPEALWVVHMNEPAKIWSSARFPIYTRQVEGEGGALPLAAARNQALLIDPHAAWVFLDVDCIPDPHLMGQYRDALVVHPEALHLGQVMYLPEGAANGLWTPQALLSVAALHPLAVHRPGPGLPVPYPLFWSLNFACMGALMARIGGFDPAYLGYGGEDTDFSFRAREQQVPLLDCAAVAMHQFHPSYDPPLNHFEAIVANSRLFYARWGSWPMEGWLGAFANLGLVEWGSSTLEVLRPPSAAEVEGALVSWPG